MVYPNKLQELGSWEAVCQDIVNKCQYDNKKFYNWLLKQEHKRYFSPYLYKRLFHIQHSINNEDRDHFIVVSGKEGTGKSTLALQIAATIDPTLKLDRICFKMGDFVRGIRPSKKGQVFVLDEGNMFLFSREAMTEGNKFMLKLFALMRQRNLCVVICVPNFFTIDSYVRDHRVDTIIHAHRKGKFTVLSDIAIKVASKEGARTKRVLGHKFPSGSYFFGSFIKPKPEINDICEESYKEHKGNHFDDFLEDLEESIALREEKTNKFLPVSLSAKALNKSSSTIINMIKRKELQGKKIGSMWYVDRKSLKEKLVLPQIGDKFINKRVPPTNENEKTNIN